jgi:hypothetical protein
MKILVLAVLPNPLSAKPLAKTDPPRFEDSPLYKEWVKNLPWCIKYNPAAAYHGENVDFGNENWFRWALGAARL